MTPRDFKRLRLLAAVGLVAFLVLLGRLVQIQVVQHETFAKAARQQQTRRVLLEPERGRIFDRHLRSLADNVALSRLSVRPCDVKNARAIQTFLAKAAGPGAVSRFKAGRNRHAAYIRLSSQLSPQQELALQATTLPEGLRVEAVPGRVYPLETVARSVVGVVGSEGDGLEGLESVYNRELKGKSGWATLFCDARGAAYELPRSLVKLPEAGASIVSTVDLDAQSIAEIELRKAVEKNGAKGGMAVFADPRTGDILAMVSVDAPGREGASPRNRVIADQYEPGSTFKVLAGCAALEERILQPSDSFYVDKGEADVGGFTIHDSHPETRWYTFRDATALSSNVCYAHIGTKVGAKTLYGYARLFGFGQPTRIMLPGEAPGQIRHPDHWSGRSLATISIGQEVLVTPLQILMAYCAVANGGELLRPRVVSTVLDNQGVPLREIPVEHVRRVVSSETARTFRSFLRDAVLSGTATEAALPWCEVAGKTGTAQKALENGRGYGAGCYVSSFVGMAPYDNPSVVGLIVIDEPRGGLYYGGSVAAPVFRDILAAWALQGRGPIALPPSSVVRGDDEPRARMAVPDVRLLELDRARQILARAGYGLRVAAGGTMGGRVMAQTPAPGTEIRSGAVIELALATGGDGETTVPDLRGLGLRDALARLTASAIEIARVEGSGTVVRQSLEAGKTVKKGTRCTLVLSPRGA